MTEESGTRANIEDLVKTFIEVKFENPTNFLKIKETLSRIGIASIKVDEDTKQKVKTLFQSCHILHKKDKYYIVHFKELFALDGKPTNFTEEDRARRNTIANLLAEWGLMKVVNPTVMESPRANLKQIKVLSYGEKDKWVLSPKYLIGKVKRNRDDNA